MTIEKEIKGMLVLKTHSEITPNTKAYKIIHNSAFPYYFVMVRSLSLSLSILISSCPVGKAGVLK